MPCTHSPQEMIRRKQRHVRSALRATDSLWAKEVPASFLKNWNIFSFVFQDMDKIDYAGEGSKSNLGAGTLPGRAAVSYTHLDVYKRQGYLSTATAGGFTGTTIGLYATLK